VGQRQPGRLARKARRELADLVFRLCLLAGGLGGLAIGLQARPGPAKCAHGGKCIADGIKSGMTPVLVPTLSGLAIGVAAGMLLAIALRRAGRPVG
jgi:hypothetical protein